MPGIKIWIPQLKETLYLNQSTYPSLDGSSTIQNLKNIINMNGALDLLRPFAEFADGINYTLKNEKTNTLITQDNATLSDLGLDVNGDQWPKIILRILVQTTAPTAAPTATAAATTAVGGRKRSTRRRRSKRRSRRKKRTKRRRPSRHRRSKKRRTRRRRKTKRRRGGTLGTFAVPNQFSGGARSIYQTPTAIMKGGMNNVTVPPPTTTIMM